MTVIGSYIFSVKQALMDIIYLWSDFLSTAISRSVTVLQWKFNIAF